MPQTLLLADDSVTIQRVIELTFADEDIKVVAVSDGDEAIARIDAEPPDIVLVDIGMPGKSGYEVAHHIKQSSRLQHIPVLLLTGAFEPVDQAKATAAGCDGVLAKPFEPQLVIARVKELLGIEGHGTPAAEVAAEPPAAQAPVSDLWGSAPAPTETETALGADFWGAADCGPAASEPPIDQPRPERVAHLDNYFAELDAAFATLDTAPVEPAKAGSPLSAVPDSTDWFDTTPDAPPDMELPIRLTPDPEPSTAEPVHQQPARQTESEPARQVESDRQVEPARQTESEPPTPKPAPPVQAGPRALPSLSDAFAAILAAEQHEPTPTEVPAWPLAPGANGEASLGDAAMEDIARRVLDRLSDRIVRETVADLVSQVAERLVREEIDRITSSIT